MKMYLKHKKYREEKILNPSKTS